MGSPPNGIDEEISVLMQTDHRPYSHALVPNIQA